MTEDELQAKLAEMQKLQQEVEAEAAAASRAVGEICQTLSSLRVELAERAYHAAELRKMRGYGVGSEELVLKTLIEYGRIIERLATMIAAPPAP